MIGGQFGGRHGGGGPCEMPLRGTRPARVHRGFSKVHDPAASTTNTAGRGEAGEGVGADPLWSQRTHHNWIRI